MSAVNGPWKRRELKRSIEVFWPETGMKIASIPLSSVLDNSARRDHARLIAAAPDMLAALKTLDSIERGMQGWHEDAKADAWAKARAAIALAEGRQP